VRHQRAPASDEALVQRAVREPAAFADVYRRHGAAIERRLRLLTRDAHVAGELTAETFAEALAGAAGYDPARGPVGAWLHGIARHRWLTWLRERGAGDRALLRTAMRERDAEPAETEAIERALSLPRAPDAVRAALTRLTPTLRDAVLLRVVGELSHAEIAARLGTSPGTVRVRVLRGLRQLAAALDVGDVQD
jgi:RNA polymerase sigma-70 factor (ECF subfamily)